MPEPEVIRSSEPYSDYGNLSGRGARRLLGAPAADSLLTAIRESVQNSWDARLEGEVPHYRVGLRTLVSDELQYLRDVVFRDLSGDPSSPLRDVLARERVVVLEIADFGTSGLGGVTRPSQGRDGEKSDFVSFLRNIGSPRDETSGSGGTYGYGKSSLFTLSNCQTVVVDSLAADVGGRPERRFMASRMGEEFYDAQENTRYTGRHWWGKKAEYGMVDPVIEEEARRLADGLGMPPRHHRSGTTIMVLDPDVGGPDPERYRVSCHILKTLLWYFWPKMVPDPEEAAPPMEFSFLLEGEPMDIPDPTETPPFDLFCRALQRTRQGGEGAQEIICKRPKKHLGWMAYHKGPVSGAPSWFHDPDLPGPVIPSPCHHVALMRSPELVVKYLSGNPMSYEEFGWGAAFIASSESAVESAFALAEPATHDDWNPESLRDPQARTFVRTALRRIGEQMQKISPSAPSPGETSSSGLAGAADALGSLVMPSGVGDRAVPGGSGRSGGSAGARTRGRSIRIGKPEYESLDIEGGRKVAYFRFEISGRQGARIRITGSASVLGEGNERLERAPDGSCVEILEWELGSTKYGQESQIEAELEQSSMQGRLKVSVPDDVAVVPQLQADELSDE